MARLYHGALGVEETCLLVARTTGLADEEMPWSRALRAQSLP
jgi:hypothetical protein